MRRFSFLAACLLLVLMTSLTLAQTATTTPPIQGQSNKQIKKQNKKIGKAFGNLDQDHDGKISRAEWNRKPKAFDQIDTNHDGYISREELLAFRQQHHKR